MKLRIGPSWYEHALKSTVSFLKKRENQKTILIIILFLVVLWPKGIKQPGVRIQEKTTFQCFDGSFTDKKETCETPVQECPAPQETQCPACQAQMDTPTKPSIDDDKIQSILLYDPYEDTTYAYSSSCKISIKDAQSEVADTKSVFDKLYLEVAGCIDVFELREGQLEEATTHLNNAITAYDKTLSRCKS